jgi:imidazolonepropionase-like amidohydrolase
VQCIDHGGYLCEDSELIEMMAERQVGFVPTLSVVTAKVEKIREAQARGGKSGLPEYVIKRTLHELEPHRRSFEMTRAAGVPVAFGTDCGAPFTPNGENAIEMEMFVRYGATEMETIQAATSVAAQVAGLEDKLGTLEAGKVADIVVVRKDPLLDIRVFQDKSNIALVILDGGIVVDRMGCCERAA